MPAKLKKVTIGRFVGLAILFLVTLFIFRKYFFSGLLPIPADILPGAYYPWLDSSWGYPVRVPIKNALPSDVVSIMYPARLVGMNMLKSGIFPFWDDTILLGVPLFANFQAALANPVNLLFFILPAMSAWSMQVLLQIPLMFFGMYLFLRDEKLNRYPSVFGALLWTFSGFTLVWLEYNTLIYAVSYFPFMLLATKKITEVKGSKWIVALGIILALQIFSGYPLIVIYSLAAAVLYLASKMNYKKWFQGALRFGFGIGLGVGLAAFQLIPAIEMAGESVRGFDTVAAAGNVKYLPFGNLLTVFAPDYYGNPGTGNWWGIGSYDNFAFFISAVGLYFLLIALTTTKAFQRKKVFFVALILLSVVFATENLLTRTIPGLNAMALGSSVNARVLFLFVFGASGLAATGFQAVLKEKIEVLHKLFPLFIYGLLVVSTILAGKYTTYLIGNLEMIDISAPGVSIEVQLGVKRLTEEFSQAVVNFGIAFRNLAIPSASILILTLVSLFAKRALLITTLALLVFTVKVPYDKYLSFTPQNLVYPQTELTVRLEGLLNGHRFDRERVELMPPNSWSAYGLQSPSGQNAQAPVNTARYMNLINTSALKDEVLTRYIELANPGSPLVNTLDMEYFIALDRHEIESVPFKEGRPFPWIIPPNFVDTLDSGTVRVFQNTKNLGRAWFSTNTICSNDSTLLAGELTSQNYDPAGTMFVDCDLGIENAPLGKVTTSGVSGKSFQVDTEAPNYLHISQTFYPGWKVLIDGVESKLYRSNIALSAVMVPEGKHIIDLVYEPTNFRIGLAISGFTALVMVVLWLAAKHKNDANS